MKSDETVAKVEVRPGDFGECLVGGSAEEQKRRRRVKRRALAVSIALQGFGLCALVIAPMLAKPAEIKVGGWMPIPQYSHNTQRRSDTAVHHSDAQRPHCSFCAPTRVPNRIVTVDQTPPTAPSGPEIPIGDLGSTGKSGLIDIVDTRVPPPPDATVQKKRPVVGHVDPAMLIQRVEPLFPPLARQIHRNGKVELHAIIATDGSIQSLEVVSGDPLFVQSALDAVRQWRYRPTMLNGQAVEIDTFITVLYTVSQQ